MIIRYFWKYDIYYFLTRKKIITVQNHHKSSTIVSVCMWYVCVCGVCIVCGVPEYYL